MPAQLLTAEDFAATRFDLPEGGRWSELIAGEVVRREPPDDTHGTVVLNLSKAVADCLHAAASTSGSHRDATSELTAVTESMQPAYACFDHPLVVRRQPDTVLSPPMCLLGGAWFQELDEVVTTTVPQLVAEIASTNDRRREMGQRVKLYRDLGVSAVWVIDPQESTVHIYPADEPSYELVAEETLDGGNLLPGFLYPVADLFREPQWWRPS